MNKKYYYTAIKNGQNITGSVNCSSEEIAIETLKNFGFHLLSISEYKHENLFKHSIFEIFAILLITGKLLRKNCSYNLELITQDSIIIKSSTTLEKK